MGTTKHSLALRALRLFSLFPISYSLFQMTLFAAGPASLTQQQIESMSARFAAVDIGADVSALPANERQALAKLVEASHLMDAIFLRQVWAGNIATLMRLEA